MFQQAAEQRIDRVGGCHVWNVASLLAHPLSLRFKHKGLVMDIKPLAKLPLSLSS
jgi:hypothetical protein